MIYDGKAFSPPTTLVNGITSGSIEIAVVDGTKLGNAPNYATIEADGLAETIRYTGLSANVLSGVTRGVEGTSRAWAAGSKISRLWTAQDLHDVKDTIIDVDNNAVKSVNGQTPVDGDVELDIPVNYDDLQNKPNFILNAGDGLVKTGQTVYLPNMVTPGTYLKITVDQYGRVTGTSTISASDLPNTPWSKVTGVPTTLAGYGITDGVKKSGDTMTGALKFNITNQTKAAREFMGFKPYATASDGDILWISSNQALFAGGGEAPYNYIEFLNTGSGLISGEPVLTEEEAVIISDANVYLVSNYQTPANRRIIKFDKSSNFAPLVTNQINLGTSALRFNNIYGNNIYANNLPSMERGTWTPVLIGSTTAGAFTYSVQLGWYAKIGQLVTIGFDLTVTSMTSSSAGAFMITGLPFSEMTGNNYRTFFPLAEYSYIKYTISSTRKIIQLNGYIPPGQSYIMVSSMDIIGASGKETNFIGGALDYSTINNFPLYLSGTCSYITT